MNIRVAGLAAIAIAALVVTIVSPAVAKPHGRGGQMAMNGMFGSTGNPPGFGHGNKRGWNGASTPPGWSKGNKHGWNGGTMPPGLSRR